MVTAITCQLVPPLPKRAKSPVGVTAAGRSSHGQWRQELCTLCTALPPYLGFRTPLFRTRRFQRGPPLPNDGPALLRRDNATQAVCATTIVNRGRAVLEEDKRSTLAKCHVVSSWYCRRAASHRIAARHSAKGTARYPSAQPAPSRTALYRAVWHYTAVSRTGTTIQSVQLHCTWRWAPLAIHHSSTGGVWNSCTPHFTPG